jgi:hypothetical protein
VRQLRSLELDLADARAKPEINPGPADEIDAVRHQLELEIVLDGPPHARFDWIAQKHGIAPSDINFGLVHPLRPARRSLGVFR